MCLIKRQSLPVEGANTEHATSGNHSDVIYVQTLLPSLLLVHLFQTEPWRGRPHSALIRPPASAPKTADILTTDHSWKISEINNSGTICTYNLFLGRVSVVQHKYEKDRSWKEAYFFTLLKQALQISTFVITPVSFVLKYMDFLLPM